MNLLKLLLVSFFWPTFVFLICRINAMTFNTFSRSITIRDEKLAKVLIADENTRGIATSTDKRNKMSILGVISYMLLLPQIFFSLYDGMIFLNTAKVEQISVEKEYILITIWFYFIGLAIKTMEGDKFDKGKIW